MQWLYSQVHNFKTLLFNHLKQFWFDLMLNVPVKIFSHVGTEPPLSGYYHYFFFFSFFFFLFFFFFFWGGGCQYVLLKDTTRRPEWGSNPRPLDPESKVLNTRPPRPHLKQLSFSSSKVKITCKSESVLFLLQILSRSLCGVVVKLLAFYSRGREFDPGLRLG